MVEIFLFRDFFIRVRNCFFKARVSIFKSRSFLFNLRCFNSSRDFFSCRDFYLKSKIFFPVVNFFMPRYFHSSRDFNFFLVKIFFEICRHFSIQGESRDVCLHSLLVSPALDHHVIYRDTHYGGRQGIARNKI